MTEQEARWVRVGEAAKILDKSERTIRRWMSGGKIPVDTEKDTVLVDISGFDISEPDTLEKTPDTDKLLSDNVRLQSETDRLMSDIDRLQTDNDRLRELIDEVRSERDYLRQALDQEQQLTQQALSARKLIEAPGERAGLIKRAGQWLGLAKRDTGQTG